MTKKDFELIASIINNGLLPGDVRDTVVRAFVIALPASNSRFNAAKFKEACYGTKKGC